MTAWVGRVSLVLMAALVGIFATSLILGPESEAGGWAPWAAAIGLGAGAWVCTASQHRMMRGAMLGAGWGGAVGFVYALVQPEMRSSENSLGAMAILAVSWPVGVLLGAVLGTVIAAVRPR